MQQLKLFTAATLPRKPYCTDDLSLGLQIRTLEHALRRRYVQPNEPVRRHWLVYDVDREGASEAWDGVAAEPNLTVINPANGHGHLLYALDVPVYLKGKASVKAIRYAAAVDAAYTDLLDADRGYVGLICKNPLHGQWRVLQGPDWAYALGDLAEWIPADRLASYKRRKRTLLTGLGRNCTLFDTLRAWAYRNVNRTAWVSAAAWNRAVQVEAEAINALFPTPLALPEVKATAKSVAGWVWKMLRGSQADYIGRTHQSDVQAARGRKSGESRRKGTPLEHDREPWIEQGVSRATWYRNRTA